MCSSVYVNIYSDEKDTFPKKRCKWYNKLEKETWMIETDDGMKIDEY